MEIWSQTQLFHSGDHYYSALINDIRHARSSILLETYIFSVDRVTQVIIEELIKARQRGCHIQILVDGFGSYDWLLELRQVFKKNDIEFRVYHPLPFSFSWFRRLFILNFLTNRSTIFKRFNKRNHRKVVIFDLNKAYLGSLNLSQSHSELAFGTRAWRDTGVSVSGTPVWRLVWAFTHSWRRSNKKDLQHLLPTYKRNNLFIPEKSVVRLNTTPRMRYRVYRDLIRRIRHAEKHILVTSAYFLPKSSLLRALKNAARRGVDVKIIVPGVTDVPLVRWAAFEIIKNMFKSGIQIFEYQKSILHAKYMIIDDYCSVGSLNLNHRSLLHDLEVEVVLPDKKDRDNLNAQWNHDLLSSTPLTEQKLKSNSWIVRMLSRIAFKLRYLL